MASSAAAQIMRQADAVKETMTGSEKSISELWVSRQKLEDLYKRLLVLDLEYALDKKVEQDLWNHAFKNQINALQSQAKDRQNPKKSEAHCSLNLFLETASGFYLQFLQMICSTFKLDVPFRRRSVAFGIIKENTTYYKNIVSPKKSSCLYICCYCLVHLGDIARYRQQTEQAQTYYRHAANLSPNNGQPYNQLAILEASRGDKLSTVFYYVRSLAVRHPFPVAATNLEKFYSKLIKDTRSDFDGPNLTVSEIVTAFLQFQALLHMATGLDRASDLKARITAGLGGHIRTQTVTAAHLTGMVAISVFGLHRARHDATVLTAAGAGDSSNTAADSARKKNLSPEEECVLQIHLNFAVKLLETMLAHTPKEDNKAKDFLTLSAIKVLLDWLYLNKDVLHSKEFNNTSIWSDLCKLLNTQQWLLNDCNKAADLQKFEDTPLPEDTDLRCFQPLEPTYSSYNFHKCVGEEVSAACERDLRCVRLVAHGKWLAHDLPNLKLVVFQPGKSIRNQFSTQKVAQASDRQTVPSSKPSQRKNIAMQTILKKQQQRQLEQDKGPASKASNPLWVISEESRPPSAEHSQGTLALSAADASPPVPSTGPAYKGRQAGVISLPHKGSNHKNLPPRLSAKASAGQQNQSISPRMQKKLSGSQSVVQDGGSLRQQQQEEQSKELTGSLGSAPEDREPDVYPSLGPDNYPALVSSRPGPAQSSLTGQPPQQSGPDFSSGWPGFVFGGQDARPPRFSLPLERSAEAHTVAPRSPKQQQQQEFMAAMQARQQQQQQQQLQFYQQQQQQTKPPQVFQPNQQPQQKMHPQAQSQSALQQPQQQQQPPSGVSQLSSVPLGRLLAGGAGGAGSGHTYLQAHSSLANGQSHLQGPSSHHQAQSMDQSAPMLARNPDIPGSSAGGGQQLQGSRRDPSFFTKAPAPVGFIPPSGPALLPPAKTRGTTSGNFSSTSMMGPSPAAAAASSFVGSHGAQNQHSLQQHFLQQQHKQQQQQQQQSGLLYQNIPLPGGAEVKGVSSDQKYTNSSQVSAMQDSRLSANFQGHTAGPSKQEKQQNVPAHFFQQAPPASISHLRSQHQAPPLSQNSMSQMRPQHQAPPLSQNSMSQMRPQHQAPPLSQNSMSQIRPQHQAPPLSQNSMSQMRPQHQAPPLSQNSMSQMRPQHQAPPLSQASMLRSVMGDPPFLQASGEYTLFSGSSSPAWPAPLTKSGHAPQHGSMSMTAQLRPGSLHNDTGANTQSMWSASGPSPLERLLEQQKNWKQSDS